MRASAAFLGECRQGATVHSFRARNPYLPRSLHLPVASTEGSVTQNLNRIGVRLWTDPSFDQDGETRGKHEATSLLSFEPQPGRMCPEDS